MKLALIKTVGMSVAIALALSGCLPRSGPDDKKIEAEAAVRVTTPGKRVGIDYALLEVTQMVLNLLETDNAGSLRASFGAGRGGSAPDLPLGAGDVVQVSIFESQSGGLFIPADAGSRPGNYITLPSQTIDRNGTISVPYAGRVQAAGRLKEQVEKDIEDQLASRAIEPQVVLTTVASKSSRVAVLGDVNQPLKMELSASGDRVLDAISEAGGLSSPGIETDITIQRRGKSATVPYQTLLDNPKENIYLAPDDTVFAHHNRRTYLVLGAAGANGRFDFEDSNLTLSEGLAKAGGLRDDRADPAEVMIYRMLDRDTLKRMAVNVSTFTTAKIPVVLRINMRDPAGMFIAQQLPLHDKDIIYISNSDSVELYKFLDLANAVTSTAAGTTTDVVKTRDAVRDLK